MSGVGGWIAQNLVAKSHGVIVLGIEVLDKNGKKFDGRFISVGSSNQTNGSYTFLYQKKQMGPICMWVCIFRKITLKGPKFWHLRHFIDVGNSSHVRNFLVELNFIFFANINHFHYQYTMLLMFMMCGT